MNQVECRLAPFEIACEGFGVRKIRLPDLHSGIFNPFASLQLGWRAELASAGLFRFVKVWVENSFLVELLPPEFRDEYVNAFGRAGIHKLEWQLRDIERGIRAQVG